MRTVSFDASFVHDDAAAYAARLAPPLSDVMRRLEDEVRREGQPAVGRAVGSLLRALVAASGGRRVVEVGCNVGYSALWMASALAPDGRIDTIEIDPATAARARANFAAAGFAGRVHVHEGAALDVLPRLVGPFDLVFLDAVKAEYVRYLDLVLPHVRVGGLVVADNMFWNGKAWDPRAKDDDTLGVRAFAKRLAADPRFATTLVPAEDGVLVAVRLGP